MHGTSQGAPVSLSGYGGLVTLARPETVPEGASPRTYDTDFEVGSVGSRSGLTSIYNPSPETIGPNPPNMATSSTWNNPNNILVQDGSYTSQQANVGNAINLTEFVLSVPSTSSPAGITLTIPNSYSDVPCNLTARLTIGGFPSFEVKSMPMPQSP